jgi:hypothetical protein
MSDPYAQLAEYARQQQELAADGRLGELTDLSARLDALIATLPGTPPDDAAVSLAAARQALTSGIAVLEAQLAAVRDELGRVAVERRTRARYTPRLHVPTVDAQG